MNDSPATRQVAAQVLRRAARKATQAGKTRTAAWLHRCADIVFSLGFDTDWPDAPAYKGAVLHVEDRVQQEIDLRALTPEQLTNLGIALDAERFRREND